MSPLDECERGLSRFQPVPPRQPEAAGSPSGPCPGTGAPGAICPAGSPVFQWAVGNWLGRGLGRVSLDAYRDLATASILEINDGITAAAGVAEGFVSAGASVKTLLLAGTAVILAGGSAAGGARYSEVRTEWERNLARIEAERASIEADPAGEFEELVGLYQAKGLSRPLARQVAAELTERDPVAAHADAELHLAALGPTSGALLAALAAGLAYGLGAAIPLAAMTWLPFDNRATLTFVAVLIALVLTGWLAAWLTGLPVLRLVRRNVLLGSAIMVASILVGLGLE